MTDSTDQTIRIWDAPVRVFHWLLVLAFAGAYLTSEGEVWRLVHTTLGYTVGGLLLFRLLWGGVGTRYARFAQFVRGPSAVLRYLQSIRAGKPEHHLGHNPAGALAIVLLIALGLLVVATGYATYNDLGPGWLAEVHALAANAMVLVVAGHVLGVLVASLQHRENLVRAMVTGRKKGPAAAGIRRVWRSVALVLLLAVLGFWWLQWRSAPRPEATSAIPSKAAAPLRSAVVAASQGGSAHPVI